MFSKLPRSDWKLFCELASIFELAASGLCDDRKSTLPLSFSTKQRVLAVVVIIKKNCLGVLAASTRVISATTGNSPEAW